MSMGKQEGQKKDTLTVVVGGSPVEVKANENQEIGVIIKHALDKAKQSGRAAEDWELRSSDDPNAQPLDPKRKLRDYGITMSGVLFLSLGSGGGGSR